MTRAVTDTRRSPERDETEGQEIEIRCDCGSLLARWTDAGLEIKCRRCKRQVVVQIEGPGRAPPPR